MSRWVHREAEEEPRCSSIVASSPTLRGARLDAASAKLFARHTTGHETIHYLRPDGSPFPAEECPLLRPLLTGETVRIEQDCFVRKDRTRIVVSYSSAPVNLGGGRGAVVAFQDISHRLRLGEVEASRARIAAAADETRRRIQRDLHDGAQQQLVSLVLEVQGAAAMTPPELEDVQAQLSRIGEDLTDVLDELRKISRGIHPAVLAEGGLALNAVGSA